MSVRALPSWLIVVGLGVVGGLTYLSQPVAIRRQNKLYAQEKCKVLISKNKMKLNTLRYNIKDRYNRWKFYKCLSKTEKDNK
ncbi:unnamed protein product [Blepharisma stoltei]|uniref:Uncharacterized protein n=1 Tax=Blepharisma stoltei TaxID=1481888 RepID=A0AAU9KEF8_9CILI|nr:unnamed protein product [Blepharisma stoltei]